MEKEKKSNLTSTIIFFVVLSVISLLFFWASKVSEKRIINMPNCWEEKIEGINKKTGNKAYYSDNFECKYFHFNNLD